MREEISLQPGLWRNAGVSVLRVVNLGSLIAGTGIFLAWKNGCDFLVKVSPQPVVSVNKPGGREGADFCDCISSCPG